MDLNALFQNIDKLKGELSQLQPLKKKDEDRLWEKFRLEWNFNSNHLEGNTLTYGQTLQILILDEAIEGHDKRDVDEMKAHDVAIELVKKYADDKKRELSEADIRELNKIILVEPFTSEAVTEDGERTTKEIIPGAYKSLPNRVKLPSGETFEYATPEDTPALMEELVEFIRTHLASTETHPVWLAAVAHHKFTLIHPFDDGNGRVARLLTNYILMKKGYPPIVVQSNDKSSYLTALSEGDNENLEPIVDYVGSQLYWSLNISILAAKGESIEDTDDVDKEIALWKMDLQKENVNVMGRSDQVALELYESSFKPLFISFKKKNKQFDDLFTQKSITEHVNSTSVAGKDMDQMVDFYAKKIENQPSGAVDEIPIDGEIKNYMITASFRGFRNAGVNAFDITSQIIIEFLPFKYTIKHNGQPRYEGLYSEVLDTARIKSIVNDCIKATFANIKSHL